MKRMTMAAVAAVVLSFVGTAYAGNKDASCAEQKKRNPKADCQLNIEGDKIDGTKIGPGGDEFLERKFVEHTSLISIRLTMVDKIIKSSNDL